MTATLHGIERVKERCNLKSKRTAEKNINRALQKGKRAEEYTSWERAYLSKEAHGNCTALAYNGFCYILNESGACLTAYALPVWFGKKKHFDGKERIRDYKKYCRGNSVHEDRGAMAEEMEQ